MTTACMRLFQYAQNQNFEGKWQWLTDYREKHCKVEAVENLASISCTVVANLGLRDNCSPLLFL